MQRFEYKKDKSNKFWEIEHDEDNKKIIVRYGKIGGTPRKTEYPYNYSIFRAQIRIKKLIKEKTDKGYIKVRGKKSSSKSKIIKSNNIKNKNTSKVMIKKKSQMIKSSQNSSDEKKTKKICPSGKVLYEKTNRCIIKKEPKIKTKKLKIITKEGKVLWDVKKNGVMLAHTFKDPKTGKIKNPPKGYPKAPNGWWLSEKFDGYRAIWDGSKFVSRNGNLFNVPDWFKDWMPTDVALDGELFMGRECFEKCGLFRKKVPNDKEWREANVKYNIFDSPTIEGPFETRQEQIKIIVKTQCNLKKGEGKCPLEYTKQQKVKTEKEVYDIFKTILEKGGEGVMLRAPKSPYEAKRTNMLLKVKPSFDDECVITGYTEGTGKYKGKLGAFKCQLLKNKDINFQISGMDDNIRKNYEKTHPIGTIVTFGYFGISEKGVPRHPNYLRKRNSLD